MNPVYDKMYYPRPFKSFEVVTRDAYGYPTLTRFYGNEAQQGTVMFEWVQEHTTDGQLNKWSLQNINETS